MKRKFKWLFALIGAGLYLFFGSLFPFIPVTKRAMAFGIGIDIGEEKAFAVSVQIPITSMAQMGTGSSSRIITAEGDSVSQALDVIARETGLTVTLTHCKTVFMGRSLAESPLNYSVLNYVITNEHISENAYFFACEGKASEFLGLSVAFGGSVSAYTQELVQENVGYISLPHKTLRAFFIDYHRVGETNWIPLISAKPVPPKNPDSRESEGGGGGEEKPDYVFVVDKIMVFKKNEYLHCIEGLESVSAFCYFAPNVERGNITFTGTDGVTVTLYINKSQYKPSYDFKTKVVKVEIKIDTILKEVVDAKDGKHIDRGTVFEEEIKTAENKVKADIEKLFSDMKAIDADVFYFKEGFFSKFGKKAKALPLAEINLEVKVKLNVVR